MNSETNIDCAQTPKYKHDFPVTHSISHKKLYGKETLYWKLSADRSIEVGKENLFVFRLTCSNGKKLLEYTKDFEDPDACLDLFFDVMYEIGNKAREERKEEDRVGTIDCCEGNGFRVSISREKRLVSMGHYHLHEGYVYSVTYGEKYLDENNCPAWKDMLITIEEGGDGKGRAMAFQAYNHIARKTR